ncbi:MAG: conjugal transfer protein TraN [Sulfurimonas sp.]|jgi:conjugal transfer mating pair stabilization protein TraN
MAIKIIIGFFIFLFPLILEAAPYYCGSNGATYSVQAMCDTVCGATCEDMVPNANNAGACDTTNYDAFATNGTKTYGISKSENFWTDFSSLAVPKNSDENTLISGFVSYFNTTAWLGIYDPLKSSNYNSVDPSRFKDKKGIKPTYTNWGLGEPNNAVVNDDIGTVAINGEHWVQMYSNATWNDAGYHKFFGGDYKPKFKAIAEWNGILECVSGHVVDATGTETIDQIVAQYCNGTSPCYVCGDGTNIFGCENNPSGKLCPAQKTRCDATNEQPSCPGGTLDTTRDMCQATPTFSCGIGYTFDASIDKCIKDVTCPDGGALNAVTDRCEKVYTQSCPIGYTSDVPNHLCWKTVTCDVGSVYNVSKDRCEKPIIYDCPTGYAYNGTTCEATPSCAFGTAYNTTRDRCEVSIIHNCPDGYSYNNGTDTCISTAGCTAPSTLNPTTDRCEIVATNVCPNDSTYNSATNKCEATPSCAIPGIYNTTQDLCLAPSTGTTCPDGYTFSATYSTCIASPVCIGGTYNATSNQCETTPNYSCTDSSYTYNSATARCEKAPVCANGTYNATYDKCLLAFTPACDSANGYSYNSTTARCEKAPPVCPANSNYNSLTNRCEGASACVNPAVWNGTQCQSGGSSTIAATITAILTYDNCESPMTSYAGALGYCSSKGMRLPTEAETVAGGGTVPSCYTANTWNSQFYMFYAGKEYYKIWGGITLSFDGEYQNHFVRCVEDASTYTCSNGATPDASHNCTVSTLVYAAGTCVTGLTPDPTTGACVANPTCPVSSGWSASFDGTNDVCYTSYQASCPTIPTLMTYDSASNMCTVSATCSNGALDTTADKCYQANASTCPTGYNPNGSICQMTPTCNSLGIFDAPKDSCTYAVTYNCDYGYVYSSALSQCTASALCVANTGLNTSTDKCEALVNYTCPTDFSITGTTCYQSPSCTSPGGYSPSLNLCDGGVNKACGVAGFSVDAPNNVCQSSADCGVGILDGTVDKCKRNPSLNCGTYSLDLTNNICYTTSMCGGNTYNPLQSRCEVTVSPDCGTYTYDTPASKCAQAINCPVDVSFSENSSVAYSGSLDKCMSNVRHDCATQYTYNGLPIMQCEAIPICISGVYNPVNDQCYLGDLSCPLGDFQCITSSDNKNYCSPFACSDAASALQIEDPNTVGANDKQAGGATDSSGNCLGNLYIFNGNDKRCRPAGLQTGGSNCCQKTSTWLGLGNCSQDEKHLSTLRQFGDLDGQCTAVGEYCSSKVLGQCVQKKKTYCCFGSPLARVIQEGGRPQLGLSWGTPESPDCRGFTPAEFQKIDFSKVDFSDWIKNDVVPNVQNNAVGNIQNVISNINTNLTP